MNSDISINKTTRKKRFNILLTDEEFSFLKEISKNENKPVSEILRNAVDYLYKPKSNIEIIQVLEKFYNKNYLGSFNFESFIKNHL